ncbi:MAG: 3-deoxy-manno-octulosonate cytidylyltransferase, partial [Bacteroidota bacterium]|nr:3-deoxy-manno-octulosonate cytidylyltransferase [Bacteroidota bacterium]
MKTLAIIPARYKSSRFEGKPLAIIGDKPMIMWVYDSVKGSNLFDKVCIATDDKRIFEVAKEYNADVRMTLESIACGTERCKVVLEELEKEGEFFDIVVNIQGDEPLIQKTQIQKVLQGFNDVKVDIVTLCKEIEKEKEEEDKNVVKVVFSKTNRAMYFSRSVIPFNREEEKVTYYKHIGIYG